MVRKGTEACQGRASGVRGGGLPREAEEVSIVVMAAWQGRQSVGTSWGFHQDLSEPHPSRFQASWLT